MTDPARPRYVPVLRRLHWLMAVLVVAAYILMEQRGLFPRGSGGRVAMAQGHYWVGVSILVLALWRIGSRLRHGAPPITPALPAAVALSSRALHLALYAFFIVMPLLGMATVMSDGKDVFIPFTQVPLPSLLPVDHDRAESLEEIHKTIASIFYWVIGLHVAAALWHHGLRRDDTLRRML